MRARSKFLCLFFAALVPLAVGLFVLAEVAQASGKAKTHDVMIEYAQGAMRGLEGFFGESRVAAASSSA